MLPQTRSNLAAACPSLSSLTSTAESVDADWFVCSHALVRAGTGDGCSTIVCRCSCLLPRLQLRLSSPLSPSSSEASLFTPRAKPPRDEVRSRIQEVLAAADHRGHQRHGRGHQAGPRPSAPPGLPGPARTAPGAPSRSSGEPPREAARVTRRGGSRDDLLTGHPGGRAPGACGASRRVQGQLAGHLDAVRMCMPAFLHASLHASLLCQMLYL